MTQHQRTERSADEIIEAILREEGTFIFSGVIANLSIARAAIEANDISPEEMWREDVVRDVIQRVAEYTEDPPANSEDPLARFRFTTNPQHAATLEAIFNRYPRIGRSKGNIRLILQAAAKNEVDFLPQPLLELIARPDVWNSLHVSEAHAAQQQANRQRQQWIAALTNNGTTNFTVDRKTYDTKGFEVQFSSSGGRAKVKDDEGFPGWTNEQLEYAYNVVMRTRSQDALRHLRPELFQPKKEQW